MSESASPVGKIAPSTLPQRNIKLTSVSARELTLSHKCAQPAVRLRTRSILKKSNKPVLAATKPLSNPASTNQKADRAQKGSFVNQ